MPEPLDPGVARAITRYLNVVRPLDTLRLVRVLGGVPGAEAASAVRVDARIVCLRAWVPGGTRDVEVSFDAPVATQEAARSAVDALLERASSLA